MMLTNVAYIAAHLAYIGTSFQLGMYCTILYTILELERLGFRCGRHWQLGRGSGGSVSCGTVAAAAVQPHQTCHAAVPGACHGVPVD